MNVLVIDDKRVIGDFFDFTLGYYGHTIKVVHDSDEAIKEASQGNFDVAFLDIIMPKKDGLEVLAEIKKMMPGLPVVMMSGYSVEEKRTRAQALGAVTSEYDVSRENVVVSIHNNGPQISDAIKDRIFEPFFTNKDKGTGIGLALCHDLLAEHGGKMTVENSSGGVTFYIFLPAVK